MSFLNGYSGYNQVMVGEDEILKTIVNTKWGTFAYKKMTFGLINPRSTLQRVVDKKFKGLVNKCIVIYMHDLTVFSKERSTHIADLKKNFNRCSK